MGDRLMPIQPILKSKCYAMVACMMIMLAFPVAAQAEEPVPTALDTSEGKDFLGTWLISLDFNGNEITFLLRVVDIGGKLGASLDSQKQSEAQAVEEIGITDEGLSFLYKMSMGNTASFYMLIETKIEDDGLSGMIKEKSSALFSAPITGVRASETDIAFVKEGRPNPTETKLRVSGKQVKVTFGDIPADSADYARFLKMEDGQIFTFTSSRATKLFTDLDLRFGDTVIKTENMAENYPGVYSLWLKRVGDGWHLVFNEQPDVWGTRYNPEADVAEIPLKLAKAETTSDVFQIKLKDEGDGGLLRLTWGDTEWRANFQYDR